MANTKVLQIKRTTVSGRTPNVTSSANSTYIYPGELAVNLTDKKLYTSNVANLAVDDGDLALRADRSLDGMRSALVQQHADLRPGRNDQMMIT